MWVGYLIALLLLGCQESTSRKSAATGVNEKGNSDDANSIDELNSKIATLQKRLDALEKAPVVTLSEMAETMNRLSDLETNDSSLRTDFGLLQLSYAGLASSTATLGTTVETVISDIAILQAQMAVMAADATESTSLWVYNGSGAKVGPVVGMSWESSPMSVDFEIRPGTIAKLALQGSSGLKGSLSAKFFFTEMNCSGDAFAESFYDGSPILKGFLYLTDPNIPGYRAFSVPYTSQTGSGNYQSVYHLTGSGCVNSTGPLPSAFRAYEVTGPGAWVGLFSIGR